MTRHIDENSAPFSLQQSLLQELEWKPTKKVKDDGTSYYFFFDFFRTFEAVTSVLLGLTQTGGRAAVLPNSTDQNTHAAGTI